MKKESKNILGTSLQSCCNDPITGFYRDGLCRTSDEDQGTHVLCAVMTKEFLSYTLKRGNNLISPKPHWNFPGLKPGDKWCLCVTRWLEAIKENVAPPLVLEACDARALDYADLEVFKDFEIKA